MGITNTILNCTKTFLKKGGLLKSEKAGNVAFGLSTGYTIFNLYKAMDDIKQNKKPETKEDLINVLSGMAAMAGSIFGPLGAIVGGGSIKLLGENAKQYLA